MYDADPEILDEVRLAPRPAPAAPPSGPETPAKPRFGLRARLFAGLGAVIVLGGLGFGGWRLLDGSSHVSTDNAYVDADSALITPQVAGQVAEVAVVDTQPVKAGQVLVKIDDTDAKVALGQRVQVGEDLRSEERRVGKEC